MTETITEEPAETELLVAAGPIRIPWATVPRVNLLPIEIVEARRFRRTQIGLAAAVLGAVVIAGVAVLWAQKGVGDANEQLATSQSRVSNLQAQQARYAAVPLVIAQVAAANAARSRAMGTDVLLYRYLNDLRAAQPTDVKLTSLTLTLNSTATSAAADALSVAGIGTVQTSGTAAKYSQVSAWLEALNKLTGLSSSALADASKSSDPPDATKAVTFTASAVITSDALSNRYAKKAG